MKHKERTKQAVDNFDKYAQMYQTKYMDVSKYQKSLDLFSSSITQPEAEILELACGPGNITKYLLNSNPNLSILATDLSPVMLELAEENNPNASFQILDCRSILELNSKFDAIICGFGLPYISKEDAIKMIEDAASALNDNGILYLSTIEGDYSDSGMTTSKSNSEDSMYMYFHEQSYLEEAIINNGLKIIVTDRVKYVDEEKVAVTDLIIIAKKVSPG